MKSNQKHISVISLGRSEVSKTFTKKVFDDENFRLFFLKSKSFKLSEYIRISIKLIRSNSNYYIFSFFSPKDLPILIISRILGKRCIVCFHDFKIHLGEENIVIQNLLYLNYFLASEIVVFNENVKTDILKSRISKLNEKPITQLFFPIDNSVEYKAIKSYNKDRPLKIFTFGRIFRYKGIEELVRAVSQFDQTQISLKIFGSGSIDANTSAIIEATSFISINNSWVSNEGIIKEIIDADIIALTYLESTQSGVMSESFTFNTPCLITPTEGLINQGAFGSVISKSFEPLDINKAIKLILKSPGIIEELSKNIIRIKEVRSYQNLKDEFLKICN